MIHHGAPGLIADAIETLGSGKSAGLAAGGTLARASPPLGAEEGGHTRLPLRKGRIEDAEGNHFGPLSDELACLFT
jgi:hypothetical protein